MANQASSKGQLAGVSGALRILFRWCASVMMKHATGAGGTKRDCGPHPPAISHGRRKAGIQAGSPGLMGDFLARRHVLSGRSDGAGGDCTARGMRQPGQPVRRTTADRTREIAIRMAIGQPLAHFPPGAGGGFVISILGGACACGLAGSPSRASQTGIPHRIPMNPRAAAAMVDPDGVVDFVARRSSVRSDALAADIQDGSNTWWCRCLH